ncbi:MAG: helix-turn-helix domain-containing protein [Eubacteriales bacterium]|nr:helix-turn-helix domain-containing protein [Eubacteriales bacterium]
MERKKNQTKKKIVSAAWRLFYEQGYENTTVDDIVELSGTSKGSFYHYFEGKDALLSSLSILFDEKYEELMPKMDPEMNSFEKLMYLNRELFSMIERTVPIDLLARMYSTQLVTRGEKHLLDHNRVYYRLLRSIVLEGQERGQINREIPAAEITKLYALCERALLYDWCICSGEYSLTLYSQKMMPLFLAEARAQ